MQHRIRAHSMSWTMAVFAIAALLLALLMDRRLNIFDEGLVLVDAVRTLGGDVIHRDFYTPYGPGANLVLAALFRVDAHWFLLARAYGIAIMAGIVAATFTLLTPRVGLAAALAATGLVGAWMLATPMYLYPALPCLLLALVGSGLLLRGMRTGTRLPLLGAGACAGAAALFRYDAGFFLALSHGSAAVMHLVRSGRSREVMRAALLYGGAAAAVFLPFALAWLAAAHIADFASDIIDYPLHHYAAERGLPFPRPGALLWQPALLAVYLPLLAVVLAAALLARGRRSAEAMPGDAGLLVFTVLAAIFYYKGLVRVSPLHMMMSIVPALLVGAVLADRAWAQGGWGRFAAVALLVAGTVPAASAITVVRGASRASRTPLGLMLAATGLKRSDMVPAAECPLPAAMRGASQEPDYLRVSAYLRRFTRPDERIFVGNGRHDLAFANAVALYFSTGRAPGTHWHQFDPGLQTRADIQARMVADLRASGVRWVVRDTSFDTIREPNASSRSSGVHYLDRFLDGNFRPVAAAGPVQVWLRNGVAPPRLPAWPDCLAAPVGG